MKDLLIMAGLIMAIVLCIIAIIAILYGLSLVINFSMKGLKFFSSKNRFIFGFVDISVLILLAGSLANYWHGWTLFSTLLIPIMLIFVWAVIFIKNREVIKELFRPDQPAQQ